ELASRFTAQQMLAREEFRKRIEKKTPIPIKDLLYPLLQAYDSVSIAADVEFGGTDQLFNILAGRELQEMVGQPPQSVFIVELLEGLDCDQMHKSKPGTAIWLTDPPSEIYGKDMPEVTVAIDGAKEIAIVDLLVLAKLRPIKGEARRAVDQGRVTVDDHRATLDTKVSVSGAPVVRVGKRHFARIRFR